MSRGMRENTCGRFRASLSVGMTTLTVGADALAATAGARSPLGGARLTTVSRSPKCCVPSIAVTQLASPDIEFR